MNAVDRDELRAKAEKASPGVWKLWGMQVMADTVGDSNFDTASPIANTWDLRYEKPRTFNAQFIAAADPPTVLALLDALAAAEARADRAEEALADAWDEGFKQGGPMHDEYFGDPDRHKINPYRKVVDQ